MSTCLPMSTWGHGEPGDGGRRTWDRGRPARMLSQLYPFEVMRAGRPRSQDGRRTANFRARRIIVKGQI
jgi:hypothetical protein